MYIGVSDQEDCSLKLSQVNSSGRPYVEKTHYKKTKTKTKNKRGLVEWLKV
jgi:hypothetical protein